MICRTCLRRAPGLTPRLIAVSRTFSTSFAARNAAAAPAASEPAAAPSDLAPLDAAATPAEGTAAESRSSCAAGTVLKGLNYFKGKTDPVALPDEAYPEWLWGCLDVMKKADSAADADAGDEFSKSKKQRRLAAKHARLLEEKIKSGDLESLVPKIPLQQQSVNLPGGEKGGVDEAVLAAEKRDELRRALRRERKAKIKETNYLKTM